MDASTSKLLANFIQQGDPKKKPKDLRLPDQVRDDERQRRAKIDTAYTINNRRPTLREERAGITTNEYFTPKDSATVDRLDKELGPLGVKEWLSMLFRKPNTDKKK